VASLQVLTNKGEEQINIS